jgi:hypothetical protein
MEVPDDLFSGSDEACHDSGRVGVPLSPNGKDVKNSERSYTF